MIGNFGPEVPVIRDGRQIIVYRILHTTNTARSRLLRQAGEAPGMLANAECYWTNNEIVCNIFCIIDG